jgi:TonB-dependent SusC/RagA subfamily outer membrane receptor
MKVRILLFFFIAAVSFTGAFGQRSGKRISVTGYVTDGTGASVANAIIMVDGEKSGRLTDEKGFYKIKVTPENKKIGVFTTTSGIIEEALDGRSKIDFKFQGSVPDQKSNKVVQGDEAVDIGYGVVKEKALTAPVGKIDGTKSKYASYNSIYEMIRGEVAGVQVNGKSIMIRSATTLNSNTEPLFIVDGVPVSTLDNILPQMVKSIEVLKGSAASIYGVRGSNGVIIVNLLKGKDK